jgi:Holliday junction DNA helicase RuvA
MIGRLSGKLIEIIPPYVVLSVGGVGYEIAVPADTLFQLPQPGADCIFWTHLVVREDAHLLYGFTKASQRDWFRQLIRISGVGPKVALSILSTFSQDQLIEVVENKSTAWLTKVPGVGKKMAERLLIELTSLVEKLPKTTDAQSLSGATSPRVFVEEVIGALMGLGYKEKEARLALKKVSADLDEPQALIKAALQELSSV